MQALMGEPPNNIGEITRIFPYLCLNSDPKVPATIRNGHRIQFQQQPPYFSGVQVIVVKDPAQARLLAEEITVILKKGNLSVRHQQTT